MSNDKIPDFTEYEHPQTKKGKNVVQKQQTVLKRDGREVPVSFDKITTRITGMAHGLNVDPVRVAMKVIRDMPDRSIETRQLDVLAYDHAAAMILEHPDYEVLAARLAINNYHKNTQSHKKFSKTMTMLYQNNGKIHNGKPVRHINEDVYNFIITNANILDSMIVHNRDYELGFTGFKMLEEKYLLRIDGRPIERIQHIFMREAIQMYYPDLESIKDMYEHISKLLFTHASPTIFNSCTPSPKLASCYLLPCGDSVEDMYGDCILKCALIAKGAGGIGIDVSDIRAAGSIIHSTERPARGLFKFLKVLNELVKHIDQGGKRNAAIAAYLQAYHPEIMKIFKAKIEHTADEARADNLFYAMFLSDLFMKRVKNNKMFMLMCPDGFPGLTSSYGDEFEERYCKYEQEILAADVDGKILEGKHKGKIYQYVKAQDIWKSMMECMIETGNPYIVFKDAINKKSNQKNVGMIRSSNLCTEIAERPNSVCNLASITLPRFVKKYDNSDKMYFDFGMLHKIVKLVVRNLNQVIDRMQYSFDDIKKTNLADRPIGIGITGLADVFMMFRFPFDSDNAKALNKEIFENMYFAALDSSCELSEIHGPYPSYAGSPISQGKLQFDLCAELGHFDKAELTRKDWPSLRKRIAMYGVRNSLLIAPMPTASTALLMGQTSSFEPRQSNIFRRDNSVGNYVIINPFLVQDLIDLDLYTIDIKNQILQARGSIQNIAEIPDDIKLLHRTVWEIKPTQLVQMAADRQGYIDQMQSFNIFVKNPTVGKLTTILFKAHGLGLKNGSYYTKTQNESGAEILKLAPQKSENLKKMKRPDCDDACDSCAL